MQSHLQRLNNVQRRASCYRPWGTPTQPGHPPHCCLACLPVQAALLAWSSAAALCVATAPHHLYQPQNSQRALIPTLQHQRLELPPCRSPISASPQQENAIIQNECLPPSSQHKLALGSRFPMNSMMLRQFLPHNRSC